MNGAQLHTQSDFEERVVQIDRVARVQRGGRRFRFRATVVVGNRKGQVGLGIGKGSDVQSAIQKAVAVARKSLVKVQIYQDSIPFEVLTTYAGAKLMMKPARPGTGIIAGGAVRPIVELAGIANILSKSLGSNNRINNAKAAIEGLQLIAGTDISKLTGTVKTAPKAPAVDAGEETEEEVSKAEAKDSASKERAKKKKTKSVATKKKQKTV